MREVRCSDPFLVRRILSCFRTSEGKITISFFRLGATFTLTYFTILEVLLAEGALEDTRENISNGKKTQYLQLIARFFRREKSDVLQGEYCYYEICYCEYCCYENYEIIT